MHFLNFLFVILCPRLRKLFENGTPSHRLFFLPLTVYVVERTLPHSLTWLQKYITSNYFVGLVQCVWPHHQILAMTCINNGCIPSLTESIAKTSDVMLIKVRVDRNK